MKILRNVTDFDPGSSTPQGAVGLGTIISAGDLTGTHGVPIVGGIGGVTVSGTPSAGEALVATSSSAAAWSAVLTNPMTTAADLIVGDTGGTPIRLAKGSDGQVLTVDPTTHLLVWANSAAGFANPMTTEGDMIYQTSGSPARLAVGGANALLHGGTDPTYSAVLPADLDVSADNTTANATTGHHGLLLKLGGGTTNFLRADGTWNAPSGGGGSLDVTDGSTTVTSVTEIDFTAGATVSDLGGGTAGVAITGGGGGLAASYLGYNTIGASNLTFAGDATAYVKKITVGSAATLLSIGAYLVMTSLAGTNFQLAVWTDSAGSPDLILAIGGSPGGIQVNGYIGHDPSGPTPGWIDLPIVTQLPAGDYWIGLICAYQSSAWNIYYDSGSDGTIAMSDAGYLEDATYRGSFTGDSNKYSIRALVLS